MGKELYRPPAVKPLPPEVWTKEFTTEDLGMRFITRRDDGDFWYVQIRCSVNGRHYAMSGKSFYDSQYGGYEQSLAEAKKYRDEHTIPYFIKVGYDPTLRKRQQEQARRIKERPRKFRPRKEAKTGMMSNLHYIHFRKRLSTGELTRLVLEVTVIINGRKYTSTAYSYDFAKYGGKENTFRIAKEDRNKLADLVFRKAEEIKQSNIRDHQTIRDLIKAVKINKTPPTTHKEPDRLIKRAAASSFWRVAIKRKLNRIEYAIPLQRFYDEVYGSRNKSRLAARKFATLAESELENFIGELKRANIADPEQSKAMFKEFLEGFLSNYKSKDDPNLGEKPSQNSRENREINREEPEYA